MVKDSTQLNSTIRFSCSTENSALNKTKIIEKKVAALLRLQNRAPRKFFLLHSKSYFLFANQSL